VLDTDSNLHSSLLFLRKKYNVFLNVFASDFRIAHIYWTRLKCLALALKHVL